MSQQALPLTQLDPAGWWAEVNTPDLRLLIEGVSFQHHDDWEAKP